MTENQYIEICSACDSVLLAPDSTIERVAIPWLHVLNEHPSNLAKYKKIFTRRPLERGGALKSALIQVRQWVRGRKSVNVTARASSPVDVIFVSHLLNEAHAAAAEDFYFGNAPEALMGRGASACVVLKNSTELAATSLQARWPADMAPRIILPETLCWRREFELRRKLAREADRLRYAQGDKRSELSRLIASEARRQALAISSLSTLRFYYQIKDLVALLRPKVIIVTFEGHAWERLAFAAARKVFPGLTCVGYHHTILFPRQHAALRPLGKPYDPDIVLTAGKYAEHRFQKSYAESSVKVAAMGIHRRQKKKSVQDVKNGFGCLVIPDGIISEIEFLLGFALDAARQAPEIPFIFHLHPMVSWTSIVKRFPRFRVLPANVCFSSAGIENDFSRTQWALYRGSNASIYAVISGLRPFYVAREGELRIDCLYQLQSWRKVVQTPTGFVAALRKDRTRDPLARRIEAADAVAFCQRYFMPINHDVLFKALKPAIIAGTTVQ